MSQVKQGSTVTLAFEAKLENGRKFAEASAENPLVFTVGKNEVLKGVEEAVLGMSPGESKTAFIPSKKALGPRLDEKVFRIERNKTPVDLHSESDHEIEFPDSEGKDMSARTIEVSGTEVIVDTNHPLAGENLTFALKVLDVD